MKRLFLIVLMVLLFPVLSFATTVNGSDYTAPAGSAKEWYHYKDGTYETNTHFPSSKNINGVLVDVLQTNVGGMVQSESYVTSSHCYGWKVFNIVLSGLGLANTETIFYPPITKIPKTITIGNNYYSKSKMILKICDANDCANLTGEYGYSVTFVGFETINTPIGQFNALKAKMTTNIKINETGENETDSSYGYYAKGVGTVMTISEDGNTSVVTATSFPIPSDPPPTQTPTAPPPQPAPTVNSSDFDPSFYLSKYPDIATAGYTTANVQNHWENSGIHEGRQGSDVFDVKFYLQKYPDLQLVYGSNYYAAHTHWQYNGIYEGRQGSASFNAQSYLQRYPDLQQAFGNDYKAAALHYMNSGKYEGRNGAP